jgi:Uma2 family endonuclease
MGSAAPKLVVAEDRTVYPIEDDMGEGSLQRFISELLRVLVERWLEAKGKPTFVGADQYFYWEQYNPRECIAPDVYVLPGVAPGIAVGAWKVWETGIAPSFALEVVSQDVDKDYLKSPAKYARLGVEELVVFDPEHGRDPARFLFQVFRKSKRGLICVEATNADRVKSKILGCHLRAVGTGDDSRLRIATGFKGETLFPTDVEARVEERLRREQAEAVAQAERSQRERAEATTRERDAELDTERTLRARLEAELLRLRGAPPPSGPKRRTSKRK